MVYAILIVASFAAGAAASALYYKRVITALEADVESFKQEADFYFDKYKNAIKSTVAKVKKKL